MIKAEIKTDAGLYTVGLATATTLKEAWETVDDHIKSGMPFEGDDGYLSIGPGASIKHIRTYYDKGDDGKVEVAAPGDDAGQQQKEGLSTGCVNVEYLGRKLTVDYLSYEGYYILAGINGDDPFNQVGPEKQKDILALAIREPYNGLVVPPGSLGEVEEYEAFLKDYVLEGQGPVELSSEEKTAKAWQGWHERGAK